jgi:hypothetical protein
LIITKRQKISETGTSRAKVTRSWHGVGLGVGVASALAWALTWR